MTPMPPKVPNAPGTKLPLPPKQVDLEIVDVGSRVQIESLMTQVESLKEDNDSLKNQVDHIRNHLNTFEFATLEHLAGRPESPSTTPSKVKKWTVIGTIAASIIAASGAITAAVINNRTARASRQQQAEVARQVVMDNQRSTSESFMAGVREGAKQAVIDMEKNKEIPPIKKPEDKKKKAPTPKPRVPSP
jgi:hypothetical protein